MAQIIQPPGFPAPRGYSNGMVFDSGRVVFVAGQIAWGEKPEIVSDSLTEQFGQALRNVVAVVREAGGGPEHIGNLTIFVTDKKEYIAEAKSIGNAYREAMGKHFPAMALVQVADLLDDRAKVEIQAIAVLP